jgi:hypothetical protein
LQLPLNLAQGRLALNITISGQLQGKSINTVLEVTLPTSASPLPPAADANVSSLRRLRWLNSELGLDNSVPEPYAQLAYSETENYVAADLVNKRVTISKATGLIAAAQVQDSVMRVNGTINRTFAILQAPQLLVIEANQKAVKFMATNFSDVRGSDNYTWTWNGISSDGCLHLNTFGRLDFDSYMRLGFTVTLDSSCHSSTVDITNVTLSTLYTSQIFDMMVGFGQSSAQAGDLSWRWDAQRGDCSLWVGSLQAGMYIMPRGTGPEWESPMFSKDYPLLPAIPLTWGGENGTGGGAGLGASERTLTLFSGPLVWPAEGHLSFLYDVAMTPARNLNLSKHWEQRYFQVELPLDV